MARNKFKAAINHIKSTQIDERIQRLNEAPTNSMSGVYDLSPQGQRYGEKNPEKTFYANADGSWPAGVPGTPGERKYIRPRGYWEEGPGTVPSVQHDEVVELDFSYDTQTDDPRNTKTLIDETTGRVKTELPPNSRSFILGPLVDLYFHNHGYDNRTYVGYIQKDTRSFVLLGYVVGTWGDDNSGNPIRADGFEGSNNTRVWNGLENEFVATNPNFTFAMLQWHHDQLKQGKYVKNVSFFNSGGVPIITGGGGTGQPSGSTQGNVSGSPTGGDAAGGADADQTYGSGGNPYVGNPQDDPIGGNEKDAGYPWGPEDFDDKPVPSDLYGDLAILGLSAAAAAALIKALGAAKVAALLRANKILKYVKDWWNKGRNERIPDENNASWRKLLDDDWAQRGRTSDPNTNPNALWDPTRGFRPGVPADKGGMGSGPTPLGRQVVERPIRLIMNLFQGYEYEGDFIAEEVGDDLIDAIENALVETETLGQFLSVLDKVIEVLEKKLPTKQVKESYTLTESRKRLLREIKQPIAEVVEIKPQKLKKYRPNFKGRFTAQNTPDVTACKESDNMVRAKNAAGQTWRRADKYWGGYESTERLNVIYDHVGHGQMYWDEVVAHNQGKKGVRNRDVQEELNKHYALLAEKKQMEELGLNEQETLYAPKDPLFKKIQNKLIPQIDYEGKPSPMGYPDGPTPQQVAGYHPEYGKRADYFNKLDPQSADAMPPTGDPEIDAKVDAQKTPLLKRVNKIRKQSGKPNS